MRPGNSQEIAAEAMCRLWQEPSACRILRCRLLQLQSGAHRLNDVPHVQGDDLLESEVAIIKDVLLTADAP